MCRLFGFRSIIPSQVHGSLLSAENSLKVQSQAHKDGWGVAYYLAEAPHVIKSVRSAINDKLFDKVSGIVSSPTVLAHLRLATVGELNITNAHPFQYGKWIFAHNGNIAGFKKARTKLVRHVSSDLKRFILGETDSEIMFHILLTEMQKRFRLGSDHPSIQEVISAIRSMIEIITNEVGPICEEDTADPKTNTFLSFILTNGTVLVSHKGGKNLYYSTYKKRCAARDVCPHLGWECENPTKDGKVKHLLVASEPIQDENIWIELGQGQIVAVDSDMQLILDNQDAK